MNFKVGDKVMCIRKSRAHISRYGVVGKTYTVMGYDIHSRLILHELCFGIYVTADRFELIFNVFDDELFEV